MGCILFPEYTELTGKPPMENENRSLLRLGWTVTVSSLLPILSLWVCYQQLRINQLEHREWLQQREDKESFSADVVIDEDRMVYTTLRISDCQGIHIIKQAPMTMKEWKEQKKQLHIEPRLLTVTSDYSKLGAKKSGTSVRSESNPLATRSIQVSRD